MKTGSDWIPKPPEIALRIKNTNRQDAELLITNKGVCQRKI